MKQQHHNSGKPITAEEIRNACARIRGSKTPGTNRISSEVVKNCAPLVADQLAAQFNTMLTYDNFPTFFAHANTILLYKKDDPTQINNYRPISLLSILYKILTRILAKRIETMVQDNLATEQVGFRRTFLTTYHMLFRQPDH